jgi:CRISPR-associated endonuclease Cas1
MIKRTLYFGNPAYLSLKLGQLIVCMPKIEIEKTIPIEDIGVIVLDNGQITLTHSLLTHLLENNVALITCNNSHHPIGLQLCLDGNTIQSERFQNQITATEALKKNLWQQTIQCKIHNQAMLLQERGISNKNMLQWSKDTLSGDSHNHEARAAAYYWQNIFPDDNSFRRERFGEYPNNFFNYAYALLRAITARSLVASGLLPTLGIHHCNRYNAYCLADDIMEPYRPFADKLVLEAMYFCTQREITKEIKTRLLSLPIIDVKINQRQSPMQIALQETTASLTQCFEQKRRKIIYPIYGE